jgi:DNA modification methylase
MNRSAKHPSKSTTGSALKILLNRFKKTRRTIPVSFRRLSSSLNGHERATHTIHSYPAKLLVHIPYFFFANSVLSKPGDVVLDPFCGSGTVLLEALLSNRNAVGFDSNPLARLISEIKISPPEPDKIRRSIARLKRRIPQHSTIEFPDIVNRQYWFYPHVAKKLLCIYEAISKTRDAKTKSFFLTCFSSCVRRVSLADPRLSVPVRLRQQQYPRGHWLREKTDKHLRGLKRVNVLKIFLETVNTNTERVAEFHKLVDGDLEARIVGQDAKTLKINIANQIASQRRLRTASIDFILTSPPYVGAQKYVRATSLNLGWLSLCEASELRTLERATIGREHYTKESYETFVTTGISAADRILKTVRRRNPLRAHIAAMYLMEMKQVFRQMHRVLKRGGYLLLVVGNNQVCGVEFNVQRYLQSISEELGFSLVLKLVDEIRSRGLMTKRNKTASLITREWVLLFRKTK